jgi:thiamine pyrophosphokinase
MAREDGPKIDFVAPPRRRRSRARVAILALEGAARVELENAFVLASRYDRKALLIAVDGGLRTCRAMRRRPDLFVGDLDSARVRPRGIASTIYPVAKDFSDFSGALSEARRLGADVAVIAGLLGGRFDHEWANLLEAGAAAHGFLGMLSPSSRGLVVITAGGVRARTVAGCLVSVFALGRAARVSLRGTTWTLSKRRLAPGSLGLSNVTGRELAFNVHEGVGMLVFPLIAGDARRS